MFSDYQTSHDNNDLQWLIAQIGNLTDEKVTIRVSEWAEQKRYLPPELTPKPGYWDNSFAPYLTEIMDCMSPISPVRKIAVEKGAQVCFTTGVLENAIGYTIDHAPCGMMYVSADKELTKQGIEVKIDRMLASAKLKHKIRAPDEKSRKTGDTSTRKDFLGGFLLAVGAQNPGKLRSMSCRSMLLDELDGMPDKLGDEGDPLTLAEARTRAFEKSRKILYLSTPLVLQTSKIHPLFLRGDQRYYFIPCKHCGEYQHLEWHGVNPDGTLYGIVFETAENDHLIEDSVGYSCKYCQGIFYNHDKSVFLNQGEWRPTAKAQEKGLRSYHLNALYSPPGLYSWVGMVYKWLECWDVKNDKIRDVEKYKSFRNLDQGLPFENRGDSPKFERVIQYRRSVYSRGEVPNHFAKEETGSKVLLVTAAADVHGNRIDVEVVGWCRNGNSYSIEWLHLDGVTDDLDAENSAWLKLQDLIENKIWVADDGTRYGINLTFIDAGYNTDQVYQFCGNYSGGVHPVMGRQLPIKAARLKEFDQYNTKVGTLAYNITVTIYKDRLASYLKKDWLDGQPQPPGYPNYPRDYGDDYFRQYEAEAKQQKIDPKTKRVLGFFWQPIGQRDNHAWDCRVYNMAALDVIILTICLDVLKLEQIDYKAFWQFAEETGHFLK